MADATDDGLDAEMGVHRQGLGVSTHLQRELAGRSQDQHAARTRLATREVQQVLHRGQQEGGGLAGSGRRRSQNIAAVQGWLQHHLLDGGGAVNPISAKARLRAGFRSKSSKDWLMAILGH